MRRTCKRSQCEDDNQSEETIRGIINCRAYQYRHRTAMRADQVRLEKERSNQYSYLIGLQGKGDRHQFGTTDQPHSTSSGTCRRNTGTMKETQRRKQMGAFWERTTLGPAIGFVSDTSPTPRHSPPLAPHNSKGTKTKRAQFARLAHCPATQ